jgi:hypothetical protein
MDKILGEELLRGQIWSGLVANTCNPSYLGDEIQSQSRGKS